MFFLRKKNNKQIAKLVKLLQHHKSAALTVIFLNLVADIFYIEGSSDARIFGILFLSIVSIIFYKLSSKLIFLLCLLLLITMFVLFLFMQASEMTEKAAVWLVLFWLVGIIRQWRFK